MVDVNKIWESSGESAIRAELDNLPPAELLRGVDACPYCGRAHHADIHSVDTGANALETLPARLRELHVSSAFVIADETTKKFLPQVLPYIEAADVSVITHIVADAEPVPEERAIGGIIMDWQPCDMIIGVGSGVVNDLSRLSSFRLGVPFGIVATAPSMDGFASVVAPMIRASLKKTYPAHTPAIIIGDKRLLDTAPPVLTAAGIADVLGKLNSLVDWKIASIVTGELYCPWVASVMRLALERVILLVEAGGDISVPLMDALVIAGLAMAFHDDSRPAAGVEHHIAHAWEMMFLEEGRKLVPHGVKVGIGTVFAMKLAKRLAEWTPGEANLFDKETWLVEMKRVYGRASDSIIALEDAQQKNARANAHARRESAIAHWDEIIALLSALPSAEDVVQLIKESGGAAFPEEIGVSEQNVRDALLYAKEMRGRYTIQQLAWDVGLLPDAMGVLL